MNPLLKQFYSDEHMREAVRSYLTTCLEEQAIEMVMNKEDVSGIADANSIINSTFIKLSETYGDQPTITPKSSR